MPRGQHQPQKQSAATKRPQKQSSAGGQASFQARVTPQLHAAEPSGQQQRQPEDSDDDEWETVGHKAGPRQAPAAKQAKLKGPSVQKPLSQAQTAQGSFGQEPQPMLEQSQIESPAAFQPLPSTQKPAAAVNIAPNSAWAKKLDLQAASSGGRGAPGPGAAASQQPAVPMSVQGKPSIQDHSYPNPPSSNAAAPSDSNHHSKPVSWPSSSAVPAEQSPQQPAGTDAAPVGASPGAAAAAPASSNAPAPSDQPKAEGRTASAGQKAKGKGKKKKGQGKQEQQGTFQEPRAEQPNPAGPVPAPGAAAIAGELKASAAGQAPRSAASAVAGNTGLSHSSLTLLLAAWHNVMPHSKSRHATFHLHMHQPPAVSKFVVHLTARHKGIQTEHSPTNPLHMAHAYVCMSLFNSGAL